MIIIDGARYSETFGDPDYTYIPHMAEIAKQGSVVDYFYNDSLTYTSRAIPALWCGSWTDVNDIEYDGNSTKYAVKPTIFEYYRKHLNKPKQDCYYAIKYISSLWLPSFDADYGPDYWPTFQSRGRTDRDVGDEAAWILKQSKPSFLLVYLADVDSKGHSGVWQDYTQAIRTADEIVGELWTQAQSDPFYKDKTTLFVTNDHGRHDDKHGGFRGHGDSCDGCRHIQFLAVGPEIKVDYHSSIPRRIPDMTVTAGQLLGFPTPQATGQVMTDILRPSVVIQNDAPITTFILEQNTPNPFNPATTIRYALTEQTHVSLTIMNMLGEHVITLFEGIQPQGDHSLLWNGVDENGISVPSGSYIYSIKAGEHVEQKQMVLLR
jgi:hypothetical protein